MNEQAMINTPTLWQRIRWKLICAHEWGEVPPKPLAGYTDATYIELKVHLSFSDKLRVLFGGIIALRTMLNTEHPAGATRALTETRIE